MSDVLFMPTFMGLYLGFLGRKDLFSCTCVSKQYALYLLKYHSVPYWIKQFRWFYEFVYVTNNLHEGLNNLFDKVYHFVGCGGIGIIMKKRQTLYGEILNKCQILNDSYHGICSFHFFLTFYIIIDI